MSDVTKNGKPLTAAEHSAGVLACEILRAEYEGDAIELLVELAEAGLGLAGSAAISVPSGREGVRRAAARLVERLGVTERDATWRDREPRGRGRGAADGGGGVMLTMETAEEFEGLVARDVRGETTEEEANELRSQDVAEEWCDTLKGMLQDLDAQLSQKAADLAAFKNACINAGPHTKGEYFERAAEHNQWRARALTYKRHLLDTYRESKAVVKAHRDEAWASRDGEKTLPDTLRARLRGLEARVAYLESRLPEGGAP